MTIRPLRICLCLWALVALLGVSPALAGASLDQLRQAADAAPASQRLDAWADQPDYHDAALAEAQALGQLALARGSLAHPLGGGLGPRPVAGDLLRRLAVFVADQPASPGRSLWEDALRLARLSGDPEPPLAALLGMDPEGLGRWWGPLWGGGADPWDLRLPTPDWVAGLYIRLGGLADQGLLAVAGRLPGGPGAWGLKPETVVGLGAPVLYAAREAVALSPTAWQTLADTRVKVLVLAWDQTLAPDQWAHLASLRPRLWVVQVAPVGCPAPQGPPQVRPRRFLRLASPPGATTLAAIWSPEANELIQDLPRPTSQEVQALAWQAVRRLSGRWESFRTAETRLWQRRWGELSQGLGLADGEGSLGAGGVARLDLAALSGRWWGDKFSAWLLGQDPAPWQRELADRGVVLPLGRDHLPGPWWAEVNLAGLDQDQCRRLGQDTRTALEALHDHWAGGLVGSWLLSVDQADWDLMKYIQGWASPTLDRIMPWVSDLLPLVPLVIILAWLILTQGRRGWMLAVGLGLLFVLTDFVATEYLRPWLGRLRPHTALTGVRHFTGSQWIVTSAASLATAAQGYGFPSAHVTNTFGPAFFLLRFHPRWAVLLMVSGVLAGLSRVYIGVHYPGDVLGGMVWGALCGVFMAWLVGFFLKRTPQKNDY